MSDSTEDGMDTLWSQVLEAWDDPKRHQVFLEYAARTSRLNDAAKFYRTMENDPDKGEFAKKRMTAIATASVQLLYATKTPAGTKVPLSMTLSALFTFLFLVGWVLYAMLRR